MRVLNFDFISGEFSKIDHAGIENEILAFDAHEGAFNHRVFIKIKRTDFFRILQYGLVDLHDFGVQRRHDNPLGG